MGRPRFSGSFTQQLPIPEDAIAAANAVMRSGRLHRYNMAPGEESEAMALEREYAAWQGARFCLAVASGGQAMQIALRAAGVEPGDAVLTNAFTLAPVPGAIAAVGAKPVLVEITDNLVLDLVDLSRKATSTVARHLLVSHMRGHMCDMEALSALCADLGLTLIEDCAHTMGALWNGRRSGSFGLAGCFSTQTYKHLNSGEGGLLTSNDARFMARAMPLLLRTVPNPELHNGQAVQMIDEVRHSTIQQNLKRLYMNNYIDPAGFNNSLRNFQNDYCGTIGRQFAEGFITGDAITAASIYLTIVAETAFTNTLFVAMPAEAAANGDYLLPTVFHSVQSDESRHISNCYSIILMALADERNRQLLERDLRYA